MKKTTILLFAITSFFVSFSAFSQNINYVCYRNCPVNGLINNLNRYGSNSELKFTFYPYNYEKSNDYILTTNADIVVIFGRNVGFLDPTTSYSKIETYYKKMISDIRNANPNIVICGILLVSNSRFNNAFTGAFNSFSSDKNIKYTYCEDINGMQVVGNMLRLLDPQPMPPSHPIVLNTANGHTIQFDSNLQSINP
ncbi:hypothetical protein P0136_03110 [Lentisphaerota bacterium ZTH]|nr:hypothetical protein JYG24_05755 [Lentisphaerota bacterium]WET06991.1 hypothetical protein P0136_03110 [Lentisphaerota bacterium ZTH]